MTPRAWISLALVLLLVAGGLGYYSGHKNQQIDRAIQQSQELKGKISALQEQARVAVDQADAAAKTAAQHEATAQALKAKLAKLRALPASATASAPSGATSVDGPSDEAALSAQIIAAQDSQITAQKLEITGLRAALDLKDRALVTAEQRARGLEIALDAQSHASKSQRWLGRIEGVAVGIAIGYMGGKLQ